MAFTHADLGTEAACLDFVNVSDRRIL